MWIKKVENDYSEDVSVQHLNFLWKSDNAPIYIMDNHLAAAWSWMQECCPDEDYNFIHIDKHSDLKGCGHPANIEFLRTNKKTTLDNFLKITYTTHEEFKFFQWDNYIRACHYLFPKWFYTNIFYTHSYNECSANDWGYPAFPAQTMEALYIRKGISYFIINHDFNVGNVDYEERMRMKKWIVNIDIDFFWDFDGTKIFDNQFIMDLGKRISKGMNNIQVLTIALSPSCCGGWNNALECSRTLLSNPTMMKKCKEYFEEKKLFPNG